MSYIDGSVLAVPTANRDAYQKLAQTVSGVFKDHGAERVVECWGDDVPDGKLTSFPMAVKKADDETGVFSWIVWPSTAARNAGMKSVMSDPRMKPEQHGNVFDGKRMIFGGFEVILDA